MNRKLVLMAVFVAILSGIGSYANGQCWGGGLSYAPVCCSYGYQNIYVNGSPPYFALYPPVYYIRRVARASEYCSFASPQATASESQQQPEPLRITNPFVEQSSSGDVTDGRKPVNRRPQMVYPIALVKKSHQRVHAE
jgi:hypothetical protein